MLVSEFLNEIRALYNEYFPKSSIGVEYSTGFYRSIWISCYLAQDKSELYNGYWENDMFKIRFIIEGEFGELPKNLEFNSEMPSVLVLENKGKHYFTKPTNPYNAYGSNDVSFRKSKGDAKKILQSLDRFFDKLYNQLCEDLENEKIHDNHKELLLSKI